MLTAVPSAPKSLQLMLSSEEPPVVSVTWQPPRYTFGNVAGYRLTYRITGEKEIEDRRLDAEKAQFTTGFLGMQLENPRISEL